MHTSESDNLEIKRSLGSLNDEFKNKTVLVTGCFGFLGTVFTKYFLSVGAKVVGMDNFVVGLPKTNINDDNFIFFNHDVCQPLFNKLHKYSISYIVNCCGIADPKIYSVFCEECMDISYIGTKNILQLARERGVVSTLCFSSSEIYGDPSPENIPTTEDYNGNCSPIGERSMYDEFKRALETTCYVYNKLYDTSVKIVRPFNTYSCMMSLKDNRILPSCMKSVITNEPIKLYKPATETRTFCYATDFIDGAIRVLLSSKSFDIFNVGNDNPEISIRDLAELVIIITNSNISIEMVDPPKVYKVQPKRRCPNITKLKILGYVPKVPLDVGIKRYYEYLNCDTIY